MSIGLPISKQEVDTRTGDLARGFQRAFDDVVTLQNFFAATPDADLIAIGYTENEVAVMKTALNDLAQLGTIWTGAAALPTAKDFRTFVRQLWGVGAF
jgi:hypothetical protein